MTPEVRPLPPPSAMARQLLLAVGYVLLYVLLDWVSYIRPLQGFNITPWNPQPALAIALLIWFPRRLWLVWVGLLAAELLVRKVPGAGWTVVLASLSLGLLYAGMARALVRRLGPVPQLATLRDLAWFTAIAGGGALLCGVVYVAANAVPILGSPATVIEAVARYWIGDFVGLLVTLPILLILLDGSRRRMLVEAIRRPYWMLVIGLIAVLLWAILGHGSRTYLHFFYLLLFIPVVLVSTVSGVLGAVLAASLTQLGLIATVQIFPQPDLTVFELQILMATITMTGWLVGVLVDEQARTAEALRDSLRLATAGQLAASLAHELSQPLTALNNYAKACQLLVADAAGLDAERRQRLEEVTQRIVTDANRAGQVIKRLRDFFRSGATRLEAVTAQEMVADALALQRQRAQRLRVELRSAFAADLPGVWLDPLQIGIVLRNLIDNGLYAASSAGPGGWVLVRVSQQGVDMLFEVCDSGAGIAPDRLPSLFDAGVSDKPGGMGIGLGICRAIVAAHGGRLWALSDSGGHFCFTLPLGEHEVQGKK